MKNTQKSKRASDRFLVIDAGNTTTHIGLCSPSRIIATGRFPSVASLLEGELSGFAGKKRAGGARPSGAMISNVVPELAPLMKRVCRRLNIRAEFLGAGTPTGIPLLYKNPAEIGPDRIANVAGAVELYGTPAIVVDIGTAITFDCVSRDGAYIGGIIAPGPKLTRAALAERTGLLPFVDIRKPPRLIGKSTAHAIQSGMIYGKRALISGLVSDLRGEMEGRPKVIFTGGQLGLLIRGWSFPKLIDPLLTLQGLRIIYNRVCSM